MGGRSSVTSSVIRVPQSASSILGSSRKRVSTEVIHLDSSPKRADRETHETIIECLDSLVPGSGIIPTTSTGSQDQQEFLQHMRAMGGISSVNFLETLRATSVRKRGTTVHEDDIWSEGRYPVETGDLDRLIKFCSRASNQCPNWPPGVSWESQPLLALQYFEQQLVYDFTHGFSRLSNYCQRECSLIHQTGRLLTRLRQSTRGAAPVSILKFLQLPRRMRADCPPHTESPDYISTLERVLQDLLIIPDSEASNLPPLLPDSTQSVPVESSVPFAGLFSCRDIERIGRPGGPVPISFVPDGDTTSVTSESLLAHNSKWNTLHFDAVPPFAINSSSSASRAQVQSLNTQSKKLALRSLRSSSALPAGDSTTIGSESDFHVTAATSSRPDPLVSDRPDTPFPHARYQGRETSILRRPGLDSPRRLHAERIVNSWQCDPTSDSVDDIKSKDIIFACQELEADSALYTHKLETRIAQTGGRA